MGRAPLSELPAAPGRGAPALLDEFEAALAVGLRLGERRASRPLKRAVLALARLRTERGRPWEATARTFWGERMTVVLPESVSRQLYLWHLHEPDLTRMMLATLRPGMVVFDVGAHIGYYSLLAAHLVGPTGAVHAFEPSPPTFAVLARNTARHPTVKAYNVAVYSAPSELTLTDYGWLNSSQNTVTGAGRFGAQPATARRTWTIPAIALDDHVETTGAVPDLVKIDAESAEYDVLVGLERTIERHHPAISVEVGDYEIPGAHRSAEIVAWLTKRGYAPHEWRDGRVVAHEPRADYRQGDLMFLPA